MKIYKIVVSVFIVVLICGCYTVSGNIISQTADIEKYQYAAIGDIMDYVVLAR